ncbi:DNA primase-helicase [Synechococcus phage ACG-2014d]|jgi:replicative DNA helicase|uniref:DnaB-like replicative helicase n=1 Tax=Synechococcus phage ACG-2014d TaxID=1493509 RepID=A0A0E3ES58_9CAUD|nr:DNA primase-helicase [Synechococcus phage ACG-2014d]YP_010355317.1 DNA primase-helicase [Synechococcus phage ACG-2014d]AIX14759.1 DNA primase-helicase [Synechococcus phage ACG-2014d]AIX15405.1 DNA primase-helicase [Synechococcus phage ACG-2014d]AIX15624.1 DNA primase-helicase [Synechococcus phage ACG-2014d]AIX16053.1 DNA primase-helicase [Synechococcus phage ACG-2014d]AIX16269.1 DNA primase-helicase [Synechococcus phage ACG-2014d]
MNTELLIVSNLLYTEDYCRKAIPFIEEDYFVDKNCRIIFQEIEKYINTYNRLATKEVLFIELENRTDLTDEGFGDIRNCVDNISYEESNLQWLFDTTEKWCQERAIYLALMASIKIADGQDKDRDKGAIPHILSEALGVSFDAHIGHDYISDSDERYDSYHEVEAKIPFDLEFFNKITKGGVPNKTLNVALAGTGVGKSLFMCHCAAASLLQGKNVLYITLEMAEEKIAERIDANLLNVNIQDLTSLPKVMFDNKINNLSKKTEGSLIIKEYPTTAAHSGHFRALINELALKKSFRPDILFIDYLNICASSRYKQGGTVNSYSYIKSVAEELRGLAVETKIPIFSATQTTRSGYGSTDVDITDTSESFGLPATADLMFALISTEELEGMNQIMVKQLKNRYNDVNLNKRFCVGIDRAKMRLYDVEQSAQNNIVDAGHGSDEEQINLVKTFNTGKLSKLNF